MAKPLAGTEDAAFPFWAPDGRAIGFFAGGKLKRLDLSGGAPKRSPTRRARDQGSHRWPQFLPDGRHLLFFVALGQVPAGGAQPLWSRDGRELFYVAPDSRSMAVPLRQAPDERTLVPGAPMPLFPTRLAGGGKRVVSIYCRGAGRSDRPIRYSSTPRAQDRPSAIAHTMSD